MKVQPKTFKGKPLDRQRTIDDIKDRPGVSSAQRKKELSALVAQGKTIKEIAELYGVLPNNVYKWFMKCNLVLPSLEPVKRTILSREDAIAKLKAMREKK